ncbi:MAG: hypothetical protein KAT71_06840 [Gammaproteobacteria bacterium]|nr:hypothetical protein [Gammaproteobacteria bacterium]
MKCIKKINQLFLNISLRPYIWLTLLLNSTLAFASDSPFGNMNIDPSDLEKTAGDTTSSTLQYIILGIGVFLCAVCAMNLIKIASRSAEEKQEHGNSLIGILVVIFCGFLGLALIAIGWSGASNTIST